MYGLLMNLTLLAGMSDSNKIKLICAVVIGVGALIMYFIKSSRIKSENRKKSEEREKKRQQLMYQQMMQQGMPPQGIQPMGMQQNLNQGIGPAEKGNGNTGTMTYTCGSCGADFESDEFPNFCPECGAGKENINRK